MPARPARPWPLRPQRNRPRAPDRLVRLPAGVGRINAQYWPALNVISLGLNRRPADHQSPGRSHRVSRPSAGPTPTATGSDACSPRHRGRRRRCLDRQPGHARPDDAGPDPCPERELVAEAVGRLASAKGRMSRPGAPCPPIPTRSVEYAVVPSGERVQIRAPDGVHFTAAGLRPDRRLPMPILLGRPWTWRIELRPACPADLLRASLPASGGGSYRVALCRVVSRPRMLFPTIEFGVFFAVVFPLAWALNGHNGLEEAVPRRLQLPVLRLLAPRVHGSAVREPDAELRRRMGIWPRGSRPVRRLLLWTASRSIWQSGYFKYYNFLSAECRRRGVLRPDARSRRDRRGAADRDLVPDLPRAVLHHRRLPRISSRRRARWSTSCSTSASFPIWSPARSCGRRLPGADRPPLRPTRTSGSA